jgi:uncharacterized Ntn-hydrolase superfamily protein
MIHPSTFSIVAYDPAGNAWGIAVASKFLSVGAVVPWAQAGAGAVATQSYANTSFGPRGLELMQAGLSAQEALDRLIAEDEDRDHRQVGLVDAHGGSATYTGGACYAWAGGLTGQGYACQGNILVGPETVQALATTFTSAKGELADRLVAALLAGDRAGGDSRGRQSAAVLVVSPKGGYAGFNDRYLDLRVDDDPDPVARLQGLLKLHHLYFHKSLPEERLPLEGELLVEIQKMLAHLNFLAGEPSGSLDEATRRALDALTGRENLEERCDLDAGWIDPPAVDYLRERFG